MLAWGAATLWPRIERRLDVAEVDATRITSVSQTDALVAVTATGYVVALRTATLGADAQTRIVESNVRQGDRVEAGTVMFRFDATEVDAAVRAAEAQTTAARARAQAARAAGAQTRLSLERERAMVERGIGQGSVVADLEVRLQAEAAQVAAADAEARAVAAQVATLTESLDRYAVQAPFAGIVLNQPAEVGAVADPTRPLVELMDETSIVVEADVPEGRMGTVAVGMPCEVVFDAWPERRFTGSVESFGPRMDRARATASVRVRLAEPLPLLPDMAARIRFLRESAPTAEAAPRVVVPASAIAQSDAGPTVYLFDGDTVRRVPVRLGERVGSGMELLEGPPPGTSIVDSPPSTLREGQLVRQREP
jgi:HlyD family secretion protein